MGVDLGTLITIVVGFATVSLGTNYFIGSRLGAQVDALSGRIDRLDERLDRLDERLTARMDTLVDAVAEMGNRITRLEQRGQ